MLTFAGIGPRKTPSNIQSIMTSIAKDLSRSGWILRSGHALGADQAFARGALHKQIFLPWEGYNDGYSNNLDMGHLPVSDRQMQIAREHHPNWAACSRGARSLLARNVPIILGETLDDPVKCVITWLPEPDYKGGTRHALNIASRYGVPVFDLRDPRDQAALVKFTWEEADRWAERKAA